MEEQRKYKLKAVIIDKKGTKLTAESLKDQTSRNVTYNTGNVLRHAEVGDLLIGSCFGSGKDRRFKKNPLVSPGEDKDTILRCVNKALKGKISEKQLQQFYDEVNSSGNACEYIDKHVILFKGVKQPSELPVIGNRTGSFNYWWYKNRLVRKLKLLSLTDEDIKNLDIDVDEAYKICLENPLRVISLNIDRVKQIIKITGVKLTPGDLRRGRIARHLYKYSKNGYCGIKLKWMKRQFNDLMTHKELLIEQYNMVFDDSTGKEFVYFKEQYESEITVSNKIKDLNAMGPDNINISFTMNTLTDDQKEAITNSLTRGVSVINGIAGSGKSTVIGEIVRILKSNGKAVACTSFTGKAVSRLNEMDLGARTMNMMIVKPTTPEWVIIDECSMVTTKLLSDFIVAHPHGFRMIMVGDCNQLKPIGWGHLFSQVIKSRKVKVSTLTNNHRSSDGITRVSNMILNSSKIKFKTDNNFVFKRGGIRDLEEVISQLKDEGVNYMDFIVITPYNRHIPQITEMIKLIYDISIVDDWSVGEKVMMRKNDYSINKMNGDEGIIIYSDDRQIKVDFGNTFEVFDTKWSPVVASTDSLVHSSSITIHRSQGSEWRYVIAYVPRDPSNQYFLCREMIYTMVTRARIKMIVVGSKSSLENIVNAVSKVKPELLYRRF